LSTTTSLPSCCSVSTFIASELAGCPRPGPVFAAAARRRARLLIGHERLAELRGPAHFHAHHVDDLRKLDQGADRRREADLGRRIVERLPLRPSLATSQLPASSTSCGFVDAISICDNTGSG
jgi:hypothetical protein